MNHDAIIIGAGPAGLAAAIELASAGRSALLLDRESHGGPIVNVEWINDYPVPGERASGAMLASGLVEQAQQAGVAMEIATVVEVEPYSGCISVTCDDGRNYTATVVILAAGLASRTLGIPGEQEFQGKGMIHCAMCDAGLYRDRVVAVCGGGNAGLIDAMFLARFASRVHVIEPQAALAATPALRALAAETSNVEIRLGLKPVEIHGHDGVSALAVEDVKTGARQSVDVYGVLVRVGFTPATEFVDGVVELDESAHIAASESLETDVAGIYCAGDIRRGSTRDVAGAVADGARAAQSALRFLAHRDGS